MPNIFDELLAEQKRTNELLEKMLGAGAGTKGAGTKGAGTKADTAVKPTFSAEDLKNKYVEVQKSKGEAVAKQLIKDMGFEKLAVLIADTANWQKYMDAAVAKLAEEEDDL